MPPYHHLDALFRHDHRFFVEHKHKELFAVKVGVRLCFPYGSFLSEIEQQSLEKFAYHDTFFALVRLPNDGVKLLMRVSL